MSTLSQFASGGVKSVQRGITSSTSGALTNVTVSAVNLSKAFVSSSCRSGSMVAPDNTYISASVHVSLTSSTNLQISTPPETVGAVPIVSWEIVESY